MYHQKPFCLVVLLLVGLSHISAIQLPCASDDDCSNGQGVCTLIGSSYYCSCLSGFGGEDCSIRPDSSCSFDAVDALESTLQTTSTLVYLYPNLTLSVSANLEESKFAFPDLNETLNVVPYSEELTIIFGNGSYAECDFPTNNSDWRDLAATAGNCEDNYSLSLAFTDAVSKCGFADDNGNRVYEQTISINRKYKLESLRGQALTRVDTSYKTLRVIFPLEVSVSSSNVQVVGSPSLLAAITDIDYLPGSSKWAVETTTSIQSPFKLVNPAVIASTGAIQADNRASTASISVVSGCSTNQQDCFQKVSLDFVAGGAFDACLGLTGSVTVELDVVCSEGAGANCPLLGGETVQLVINLATSDACPVTEEITFSTTTLSSFSDAGASNARSSFITNQIAYFGADIQSDDAHISARNVKSGSVCFQIGAAACQPVAYQVETSDNGKDPIFSVDFSAVANVGVFGNLNLASATSENYQVKAVIEVDFSGVSKKAGIHKSQQATGIKEVRLTTSVKLAKADHSEAAVAIPSMILVAVFLFGMLL